MAGGGRSVEGGHANRALASTGTTLDNSSVSLGQLRRGVPFHLVVDGAASFGEVLVAETTDDAVEQGEAAQRVEDVGLGYWWE